jgi:hypothetical protein
VTDISTGASAELVVDNGRTGFGITGAWGAGEDVPSPEGKTVRERAEVFFERV